METGMSDEKKKELPPASEAFWDAIISAGTSGPIECGHCGLIHFAYNAEINRCDAFDSDEEHAAFLAEVDAHPEKFFRHDSDDVSWGYVGGEQTPYDCPCRIAGKYERAFWSHRLIICDYFLNRARAGIDKAKRERVIADDIETALEIMEERRAKRRAEF